MKFAIVVSLLLVAVPASAANTLLVPVLGEADPTSRKTIDAALRARLAPVVTLVSEGETSAFIEGLGQLQGCSFDTTACPECSAREKQCIEALGELSGADTVLIADTKALNAGTRLIVHRYDVTHQRVLQSAEETVRITIEGATFDEVKTEQTRCARGVVTQIYQPDAYLGEVKVEGPPGALVIVDGEQEGPLPAAAKTKVKPGEHKITVKLPSGDETEHSAVVVFGDVTIVNINGNGSAGGGSALPVVPISLLSVAGAAGVVAAAALISGGVLLALAPGQVANWTPDDGRTLSDAYAQGQTMSSGGVIAALVGATALLGAGALGVAGGILWVLPSESNEQSVDGE